MEKEKVFVIGFQKTGTTSLETALERLGYRVYGGDKNLMKFAEKDDLKDYIHKVMSDWDAAQDMPWPLFYKILHEVYPNAKFILTYREPEKWIKSVVHYFASIRIPLHQKIYNVPCAEGYEETYLKTYREFNVDVQEYFRNDENFLLMKMGENFDYKTLCEFLNLEVLKEEFPRSRQNSQSLAKFKVYRHLRSAYHNFRKRY